MTVGSNRIVGWRTPDIVEAAQELLAGPRAAAPSPKLGTAAPPAASLSCQLSVVGCDHGQTLPCFQLPV